MLYLFIYGWIHEGNSKFESILSIRLMQGLCWSPCWVSWPPALEAVQLRDDVGIPKNLKHTFWRICELCISKLQSSFFSTKKVDTSLHLQRHGALAAEAIQPREGFFFLCVNCAHFLCAPVSPPQLLSRTELRHLYLCRRVFDSCSVNLTLYVI